MSSNIRINKICIQCGEEFEARKTTTRTCSDKCANRYYKARKRAEKIEACNKETLHTRLKPIEDLKAKEYLTVADASILLNSSTRTVYRLIHQGNIKAVNLSYRKTLIKRSELDKLFMEPMPSDPEIEIEFTPYGGNSRQKSDEPARDIPFDILNSYTIPEALNKFRISELQLTELIKSNGIPTIQKGWYTYISKVEIDKLLS
jgi:excisionase family DNA binding protein